jgi:hypothetical protein
MHQKVVGPEPFIEDGNLTRWLANTPNCQFIVDRVIWPNHRWSWRAVGCFIPDKKIVGPLFGKDATEVARILNLRENDGKLVRFNRFSFF